VKDADVIHLMNHWTVLNALTYRAIRKYHKPYVVCPAGALPLFGRSRLLKQFYNALVGNSIVVNADRFIAITESEIPHYLFYGGQPEKVVVIPNGISSNDFTSRDDDRFRRKFNLPDKPILLFLGRLNLIKGPDILLRAFIRLGEEFGEYQLVYAGPDGGMLTNLMEIARVSSKAKQVHFVGNLAGDNKSEALHAASLLIIPSRQEAMSIVAVEGGICGTPVLLTDQCGFDAIGEIGGGLIVPASEEGLLKGLQHILSRSTELADSGDALRRYVLKKFLWENLVGKFVSLYEQLLVENTRK